MGEQPGDQEDREGRPFVGPAGQLLDQALEHAGLDRGELYLTQAVKHFRFEERGKRRIHKTASKAQVSACQPWVEAEMARLSPKLIVCLGQDGRSFNSRPRHEDRRCARASDAPPLGRRSSGNGSPLLRATRS